MAIHLLTTSLRGVPSMKLQRDLGIRQASAWHVAHRIREARAEREDPTAGPVEVDEIYLGGKARNKRAATGSAVYTDEHGSYEGLEGYQHETVQHKAGEYVRGAVHTDGIETFLALLKRGYHGTYHKVSVQRLPRYLREFTGRLSQRDLDTRDQMASLADGLAGKRLSHHELRKAKQTA